MNITSELEDMITKNSIGYFLKSTPFPLGNEYNYDGVLKDTVFFENLYSDEGEAEQYFIKIKKAIIETTKKTVVLLGYQGCGKTTFINRLRYVMNNLDFNLMELDTDTSNIEIPQYIEKYGNLLLERILDNDKKNNKVNTKFYNLYKDNKKSINLGFGAKNNLDNFMINFRRIFVLKQSKNNKDKMDFINEITKMFFGQILCCIILLDIASFVEENRIIRKIYCIDNIDVLVNSETVENFFEQYYAFSRNMNKVFQNFTIKIVNNMKLSYSSIFTFIICSRESTWSKVANGHINDTIMDMTEAIDVSDAYDKVEIVNKRVDFLNNIRSADNNSSVYRDGIMVKKILQDLLESKKKSIFIMFNNDYRRCVTCIEYLLNKSRDVIAEYEQLHNYCVEHKTHRPLYGARGMIYRKIWDIFKKQDLFKSIGVVNVEASTKAYSDARLILTYLSNRTSSDIRRSESIDLDSLYNDLRGVTSEEEIQHALCSMYNIRRNTYWNQLVSFSNIRIGNYDEVEKSILEPRNNNVKVHITKAGETYLDLIATHFEFFSCRVTNKKEYNKYPLFVSENWRKKEKHKYYFQFLIENVIGVVENCCKKMHEYFHDTDYNGQRVKEKYLESYFVYHQNGGRNVFHGERIIHTHIRYLDAFRLYLLKLNEFSYEDKVQINYLIVDYINQYIKIGRKYTNILSNVSTGDGNEAGLFVQFEEKMKIIDDKGYADFEMVIDV